jgi:hypothetical protein
MAQSGTKRPTLLFPIWSNQRPRKSEPLPARAGVGLTSAPEAVPSSPLTGDKIPHAHQMAADAALLLRGAAPRRASSIFRPASFAFGSVHPVPREAARRLHSSISPTGKATSADQSQAICGKATRGAMSPTWQKFHGGLSCAHSSILRDLP